MEAILPTEVPSWLSDWMARIETKVDRLTDQTRSYNPQHCYDQDEVLRRLQDESAARKGSNNTVQLTRGWILAFATGGGVVIAALAFFSTK